MFHCTIMQWIWFGSSNYWLTKNTYAISSTFLTARRNVMHCIPTRFNKKHTTTSRGSRKKSCYHRRKQINELFIIKVFTEGIVEENVYRGRACFSSIWKYLVVSCVMQKHCLRLVEFWPDIQRGCCLCLWWGAKVFFAFHTDLIKHNR